MTFPAVENFYKNGTILYQLLHHVAISGIIHIAQTHSFNSCIMFYNMYLTLLIQPFPFDIKVIFSFLLLQIML